MNYRELNQVRDIQVLLKEAHLYSGSIDGKWGPGTGGGLLNLFADYHKRVNGGRTRPLSISTVGGEGSAKKGIMDVQSNLKLFNLYEGVVDGVSGPKTVGGLRVIFNSYIIRASIGYYSIGWSNKVPEEFAREVLAWKVRKGYWEQADSALMGCMHFESGGTFDPAKRNNGGSNYWGLIQFGNLAAQDLGVPLETIKKMSQMEQLMLTFKYFDMWERRGKRYNALEDLYLTIFYPSAVGRKVNDVLFRRDSNIPIEAKSYLQNNGFDFNKDGIITVGEITTRLYTAYYDGLETKNRRKTPIVC